MRVTLSLAQRLFAAALVSFAVVGVVGLELVRWQFLDNFSQAPPPRDPRLATLAAALQAGYAVRHDWSFLPVDADARNDWLRRQAPAAVGEPEAPAFEQRVALQDAARRVLAGSVASRWLVALASIDTVVVPLHADGQVIGRLALSQAQRPEDDLAVAFLISRQQQLALAALLATATAVIASAGLAAHFRRPVTRLVNGARRLSQGQFEARLPAGRGDELGELARTFNQLAQSLEEAEGSRRRWMADTSHELRTPLAVLRCQLEAMQDGVRSATADSVGTALAQVVVLTRLVDDLQSLSAPSLTLQAHDAWCVATDTVEAFGERLRAAGLGVTIGMRPVRSMVHADGDRLRQVVSNLLENSVRYTDPGGHVALVGVAQASTLTITLDDAAPGVAPAALARLGERFFRVDASRSRRAGGSGLGLAVSRRIVEAHGGRLSFEASPLGGLRAIVTLPLLS